MVKLVVTDQTFMAINGESVFIFERARKGSRKLRASVMPVEPIAVDCLIAWGRVPLAVRRLARAHFDRGAG